MIAGASSVQNQCRHRVVAQGAILRFRATDPQIAGRVAVNHRKAHPSDRPTAMPDVAVRVSPRAPSGDCRGRRP